MIQEVVITDAWLEHEGQLTLNPALNPWQKQLLSKKQRWRENQPRITPLSWFSDYVGENSPAALLAALATDIPDQRQQFWVVSPYHARLSRSVLRVMPESLLDVSVENVLQIRGLINPLLMEHGMSLHVVGGCLVLACDRVWDVSIEDFACVSGQLLPNRLPPGKDAKDWLRLLTEIQMTLQMSPVVTAQGLPIHGLWFWGGVLEARAIKPATIAAVATRNFCLRSLLQLLDKERGASTIVTEACHLPDLINVQAALPKRWLLLGGGKSVTLTPSVVHKGLARVRTQQWKGI